MNPQRKESSAGFWRLLYNRRKRRELIQMFAKKEIWYIKLCLTLLMLAVIILKPAFVYSFWRGMLIVGSYLLLSILNYYAEENRGCFKERRDNLLFDLIMAFILFLVLCYAF